MTGLGLIGFGRVGRTLLRVLHQMGRSELVRGISEINPHGRDPDELTANLAYLLAHDSTYGILDAQVSAQGTSLILDGREIPCFFTPYPGTVDWAGLGASVVVEASGDPKAAKAAAGLPSQGVAKVVFTCSEATADITLVRGLNLDAYDPSAHHLVSCSTCTANALAPLLALLDDAYGVAWASVATVHPALSGDTMLDQPCKEFALGRSGLGVRAASSGLAASVGRLLPNLAERIEAMSFRVPTTDVNALLANLVLERPPGSSDHIVDLLQEAEDSSLAGVMRLDHGFLGQSRMADDFKGDPHSAVVDLAWLSLRGPMTRLMIWHDNEWAYCMRVADVIETVSGHLT